MSSNDDPKSADDSTKQVDRRALDQALNKSVDSREIMRRVNASISDELHTEGTAKVDRDAVRTYLEAARSGEMIVLPDPDDLQESGEEEPPPLPHSGLGDAPDGYAPPEPAHIGPEVTTRPPAERAPVAHAQPAPIAAGAQAKSAPPVADAAPRVSTGSSGQFAIPPAPAESVAPPDDMGSLPVIWRIVILAAVGSLLGIALALAWLGTGAA